MGNSIEYPACIIMRQQSYFNLVALILFTREAHLHTNRLFCQNPAYIYIFRLYYIWSCNHIEPFSCLLHFSPMQKKMVKFINTLNISYPSFTDVMPEFRHRPFRTQHIGVMTTRRSTPKAKWTDVSLDGREYSILVL